MDTKLCVIGLEMIIVVKIISIKCGHYYRLLSLFNHDKITQKIPNIESNQRNGSIQLPSLLLLLYTFISPSQSNNNNNNNNDGNCMDPFL